VIRDSIYNKYFEAFNFYFAKPINEILANVPNIDHIVAFKDYLVYDEEGEYLKRYVKNYEQFEIDTIGETRSSHESKS
jgi:hypothetical protein